MNHLERFHSQRQFGSTKVGSQVTLKLEMILQITLQLGIFLYQKGENCVPQYLI
jgi:hypothetical protein